MRGIKNVPDAQRGQNTLGQRRSILDKAPEVQSSNGSQKLTTRGTTGAPSSGLDAPRLEFHRFFDDPKPH